MKRKDLEKCLICKQGMAHNQSVSFYEIKLKYHILDMKAIMSEHGFETFFGGGLVGARLASAMGSDPDLTHEMRTIKGLICMHCAIEYGIARLMEEIPLEESQSYEEGIDE